MPMVLLLKMELGSFFRPSTLLDVLIGDLAELGNQDFVHLLFQENSLGHRLKQASFQFTDTLYNRA